MFEVERQAIEAHIRAYCTEKGLPQPETIQWTPLHFEGGWGISTSFFQLAALEARASSSENRSPVPQRAQEIAAQIAEQIGTPAGFSRSRGRQRLSEPVLFHHRVLPPGWLIQSYPRRTISVVERPKTSA